MNVSLIISLHIIIIYILEGISVHCDCVRGNITSWRTPEYLFPTPYSVMLLG